MKQPNKAFWGDDVWSKGHCQAPNYLIDINEYLPIDEQLKTTQIFILITLLSRLHNPDRTTEVFLTIEALSAKLRCTPITTSTAINGLIEAGWLGRTKKRGRNEYKYDLKPMVEKVQAIASANPKPKLTEDQTEDHDDDDF